MTQEELKVIYGVLNEAKKTQSSALLSRQAHALIKAEQAKAPITHRLGKKTWAEEGGKPKPGWLHDEDWESGKNPMEHHRIGDDDSTQHEKDNETVDVESGPKKGQGIENITPDEEDDGPLTPEKDKAKTSKMHSARMRELVRLKRKKGVTEIPMKLLPHAQEKLDKKIKTRSGTLTKGVTANRLRREMPSGSRVTNAIRGVMTKHRTAELEHPHRKIKTVTVLPTRKTQDERRAEASQREVDKLIQKDKAQVKLGKKIKARGAILTKGVPVNRTRQENPSGSKVTNTIRGILTKARATEIETSKKKIPVSRATTTDLGQAIGKRLSIIKKETENNKKPKDWESKEIEALHGAQGYQTPIPNPNVDTNWEHHPSVQGIPGSPGHNLKMFVKKGIHAEREKKAEQQDYDEAERQVSQGKQKPIQSLPLQRAVTRLKKGKKNNE